MAPSAVVAPDARLLRAVALTYDDGPARGLNEELRGHLDEHHAAATFFLIGNIVPGQEDLVAATSADGHEVGCHSWTHRDLARTGSEKLEKEIGHTTEVIRDALGRRPLVMRPPYGARDKQVDERAGQDGQSVQLWDVDTLDWQHKNGDKTLHAVTSQTRRGSIILMHEIHQASVDATPRVLQWLDENDYTLLTCSELGQNQMWAGKHYTHGLIREA
ncbi:polysaccharide deacetylase family protein [Brachybacterium sillae]|uniref:polysaccharide deacetylase family protein n=1 Tax=Brachybacterium sillae TaxID=2810536 RepID=UPI00217E305D|nr:polysaccharide deacetylase family protein [Brachybacterium sillae]